MVRKNVINPDPHHTETINNSQRSNTHGKLSSLLGLMLLSKHAKYYTRH